MDLIPKPQLTPLLTNDVLARVERMRINANRRFTARSQGEHLTGRGGSSTEFSDYRNYAVGDDLRFIDWNIFARMHRPYLKLFRREEEMHVLLLVDASSSMMFEKKLELAKQLAAALGVMGLYGTEKVSVCAFNDQGTDPLLLAARTGRANLRRLLEFIEGIEGGGNAPVDEGIESLLKRHRGRGVAIIISDFLTFGDLRRSLNMLFSSGFEIFGLQVLSPTEFDPQVAGDIRLVDSETGGTLDVSSAGDLLGLYQEYRQAYQIKLEELCTKRGGKFLAVNSQDPIDRLIFDVLRRRGWVK